jgi:glycosyltransferase involved in cell wall biosynthesis
MVVLEAFAGGTPVVASNVGALPELVADGCTGLLFEPKESQDLASKLGWLWGHPQEASALGSAARSIYEKRFTPEQNYQELIRIYTLAMRMHTVSPSALNKEERLISNFCG